MFGWGVLKRGVPESVRFALMTSRPTDQSLISYVFCICAPKFRSLIDI